MARTEPDRTLEQVASETRARRHRVDLRRFITDVVTTAGGIVDVKDEYLLHVALPAEVVEGFSLPEFGVLAFDYDAAKDAPAAEFVTFGSPVLDRFVALGLELGRVTREYARSSAVRVPPNLMGRIESRIGFNRSRRPVLRATSIEAYERAVFGFVVSYISDERFSESVAVAVDTTNLADDTDLLDESKGVTFSSEPQGFAAGLTAKGRPYSEVLQKALECLQARVRPRLATHQAEVRGFCEKELVTVLGFYERTLADLAAREEAAAAAGDPDKKARIHSKIEASQVERQRRIADIVSKYRVRAEARLDSVTLQVMPKVRALLEVRHKDSIYTQPVFYNLATNSVEPLTCPRCGRRFFSAYPAKDGMFVCSTEEAE